MKTRSHPAGKPLSAASASNHRQTTVNPGKPKSSGYAEPKPGETTARDKPNPAVAGDETSQTAPTGPGENVEYPETEPGEEASPDEPHTPDGNVEYPPDATPIDLANGMTSGTPNKPGENEDDPQEPEPLPPGEHQREPINDPDPAHTKLHA